MARYVFKAKLMKCNSATYVLVEKKQEVFVTQTETRFIDWKRVKDKKKNLSWVTTFICKA